eukprot:COSAG01_NODE_3274_length_6319_cov_22.538585_8_plen_125_part_00
MSPGATASDHDAVDPDALASALEDEADDTGAAAAVSEGSEEEEESSSDSEDDDPLSSTGHDDSEAVAAPDPPAAAAMPAARAVSSTVSAADAEFKASRLTMLHIDLEHQGSHIVQLSGEINDDR